MVEPIIVLGMPRTGSSMTAGIFAQHGVWAGTCRAPTVHNEKGYFENLPIKNEIKRLHKGLVHKAIVAEQIDGFRAFIEQAIVDDGYVDGPWMWKGSVLYWPAFFEFKPKWVLCRRDKQSTFNSCRRSGQIFGNNIDDKRLWEIIDAHHGQMDYLAEMKGALEVDTKATAHGDFGSIRAAIEGCGVEFSAAITEDFIDPALWHHA